MIFKIEWVATKLWKPGANYKPPHYRSLFAPPMPLSVSGPAYVQAQSCFEALQRFGAWWTGNYLSSEKENPDLYTPAGYVGEWHGPAIKSVEEVPGQLIV